MSFCKGCVTLEKCSDSKIMEYSGTVCDFNLHMRNSFLSFNDFIIYNNVLKVMSQPITLNSGQQSLVYVNWRNITENVYLFENLLGYILNFIEENHINSDCFYGVPEGCSKIGMFIQYFMAKKRSSNSTLAMGRGKIKDHGEDRDRYFIGSPTGTVTVIEDVCTTGDSLLKTITTLKNLSGVKVDSVIVLTDRLQTKIADLLLAQDIKFFAMSNLRELLELKIGSDYAKYLTMGIE